MSIVRTRIAPSPTGYLHIGTVRTALFNYLFAKKQGGSFIVRIEDTDLERSDKKYEKEILDSLDWLGIKADESPQREGEYGPYRQSQRIDLYRNYLEKLLDAGQAFYCFHTEEELAAEQKNLRKEKKLPVHVCTYRDLSREEGRRRVKLGERAIIRFKTPAGPDIRFNDLIRGEINFSSDVIADFSLAKDLSTPLYNFAVVIDDHDMKISHVIRGEDHISNTPKQILIWKALWPDEKLPDYAHLPLILGPDRSKLSKRHGATSIREYNELGYLAEALVNFMALLGWNPGDNREMFSMSELIKEFDLAKVQKSAAVFNIEKLDWLNGEYLRKKTPRQLAELALKFLQSYTGDHSLSVEYIEPIAALEQSRIKKLSEIGEQVSYFFRDPDYDVNLLRWKNMTLEGVRQSLERAKKIIEEISVKDFTQEGIENRFFKAIGKGDKGEILWPLRVALTGKKASPGPFEIMANPRFGKKQSLRRVQDAMAKILIEKV